MLEFIRSVYRVFVLIGFWVFLIVCTIGGGIIGNGMGGYRSDGHPILGGFIGLIIGFVINVLVCGFIATILNMDENLETLAYNSSKRGTSSENTLSGGISNSNDLNNAPPINRNYGDTWVCKKCGERNPVSSSSCKGCGEYK